MSKASSEANSQTNTSIKDVKQMENAEERLKSLHLNEMR